MAGKEQWVMATVSCHQFCQYCAEVQRKKLKQSLSYCIEPDKRDWYSCMHNVYKIRDLSKLEHFASLLMLYRIKNEN